MKQLPLEIFCDFDGTISVQDITDLLLERLADAEWREIEDQWAAGNISTRECMAKQIQLIQGGWEEMNAVLKEASIDPTFESFTSWCRDQGIKLHVVSDGLDYVIKHLLGREHIKVDTIIANELILDDTGKFFINIFHPAGPRVERRHGCGGCVCKCSVLETLAPRKHTVVIGDGRSDFCWAPKADTLFVKNKLHTYAEQQRIPHVPFQSFTDIQNYLEGLAVRRVQVQRATL